MNTIKLLREGRGWSLAELAEVCGTYPQRIHRLELGQTKLKQSDILMLAEAFDCSPNEIIGGEASPNHNINIKAHAITGKPMQEDKADSETIALPLDKRYVNETRFAVVVADNSMNKTYPMDSILICIKISDNNSIPNNCHVIANKKHPTGNETIVRRYEKLLDGSIWLWPSSNDPHYQTPIELTTNSEYQIKAKVIASYRLE